MARKPYDSKGPGSDQGLKLGAISIFLIRQVEMHWAIV